MTDSLLHSVTEPGEAISTYALTYAQGMKSAGENYRTLLAAGTRLLFVTSEMGDFIKAGGLGEVSSFLPRHLRKFCDVRVLLPGYRSVRDAAPSMQIVSSMPGTAGLPPWSLGRFSMPDGLTIYAVLCDELYDREGSPYGPFSGGDFIDNDVRFARLSLSAAEIAAGEADPGWKPRIVHVNDWPTALTPGYMLWKGLDTRSILTIHNMAYQGLYERERMSHLGIPEAAFSVDGAEFHGGLSFLKAGIFHASHITTVSETYAREITMQEHGCGLDGLLRTRMNEGRLTGIINGIDESWSGPLGWNVDADLLGRWKRESRAEIRRTFTLPPSNGPMFSIISRLVHQKGIDLSIEAAETIIAGGGQLVVTGRGEPRIEEAVKRLARLHPDAVGARIGFDDAEARRLFAASDFLLMPSRFEPCGLSQMYAQRSGALPIAYRTGGLIDTIEDGRSGFLFSSLTGAGLSQAVLRAFAAFRSRKSLLAMRRFAMSKHYDWTRPSSHYADVYAQALAA